MLVAASGAIRLAPRLLVQLTSARRRADESRVAFELGVPYLCFLCRDREGQALDVPANALQEAIARRDHAAAEDHHVWVDGVHEVHGADGEVISSVLDDAFGERIAGRRYVEDVLR